MIIFGIVFGRPLYALWCPKGAQKEVFVDSFRSDFEVSGENENEAPVETAASFSRFQAPKRRKISTLFSEEVRGSSGIAVFRAFDVFGCPPEFKKGT